MRLFYYVNLYLGYLLLSFYIMSIFGDVLECSVINIILCNEMYMFMSDVTVVLSM